MPRILIDNTPPSYVFQDGNNLTDGMASLAQALVQAPIAAAGVRRQVQQDEMANLWRSQAQERQQRQDQLQQLWHDEAGMRQDHLDALNNSRYNEAQRRQAELDAMTKTRFQQEQDRGNIADFEHGVRLPDSPELETPMTDRQRLEWAAVKRGEDNRKMAELFAQGKIDAATGKGTKVERPTAATLKAAHELADAEALNRGVVEYDEMGKRVIKDPKIWNLILRESYALHGVHVPESWNPAAVPAAGPAGGGAMPEGGAVDPSQIAALFGSPGGAPVAPGTTSQLIQAARDLPSQPPAEIPGLDFVPRGSMPLERIATANDQSQPIQPAQIRAAATRHQRAKALRDLQSKGQTPALIAAYATKWQLTPDQARAALQAHGVLP